MLDDFVIKKSLGKGTFGKVLLVENQQHQKYALKIVPFDAIQKNESEKEYIYGEINFLKAMNSPYIIKLYQDFIDDNNIYMVLEYCNMGDLYKYQMDLPGKVFTLEQATKVLRDVIIGLEEVHKSGSVHRDIKSNNILVHSQNGKQIFKLADFGFVKKTEEIRGTILGTQFYMSPEIYDNQSKTLYGFEIDMWAFGVLFFYMLNNQYPFKIQMGWLLKQKKKYLEQRATNFSYSSSVKSSKKNKMENCTPELEDLFKRMFEIDGSKRITFSEIRKHPVFALHFPNVDNVVDQIYGSAFGIMNSRKKSSERPVNINEDLSNNFLALLCKGFVKMKEQYNQGILEKLLLERTKNTILFIIDNASAIYKCDLIEVPDRIMLAYSLLKFSIIKLKQFKARLAESKLEEDYPGHDWKTYFGSGQFSDLVWEVDHEISRGLHKFANLYLQCQHYLKEIYQINQLFSNHFIQDIDDNELDQNQKICLQKSALHVFKLLHTQEDTDPKKVSKIKYIQSLILLSYGIFKDFDKRNQIIESSVKGYHKDNQSKQKFIFDELRTWLEKNSSQVLNNIFFKVMKNYVGIAAVKTS